MGICLSSLIVPSSSLTFKLCVEFESVESCAVWFGNHMAQQSFFIVLDLFLCWRDLDETGSARVLTGADAAD
jgi:hypothetical protein